MQRYELSDGSSNKFWAIERTATGFTVTFGRIGTNGQTQTKEFGDAATAQREHDKLVAEKVKKGYQLVGSQTASAPRPKAAPATATAAAAATAAATATAAAAATAAAPATAAGAAPAAASTAGPRLVVDAAELAKRAAAERKSLRIEPLSSESPVDAYATLFAELNRGTKAQIQNGLVGADPEAKRLANDVLRVYGISKVPAQLEVETAAAALQLMTGRIALIGFWVAQVGLGFVLEAFATSLWDRIGHGMGAGNRAGVTLSPRADRSLAELTITRTDRIIHAYWLGQTPAKKADAVKRAEALRASGTLLQRSAIASATLEPAWIDADLAEHARTRERALLTPQALMLASNAAHVAAYYANLADVDTEMYRVNANNWVFGDLVPITGHHYVEKFGLGGVDIALARLARLSLGAPGGAYFSGGAQAHVLFGIVELAHDYPPAVAAAVRVLDEGHDLKLSKGDDPRPIAQEIVNRSPALALPLLQPLRKQWAKDLSTRLRRITGAIAETERPEGTAPAALQNRKLKAPELWQPAALPRIALRDGTLYPLAHLDSLAAALVADDRAAIAQLRDLADRDSLAQFGWELFQLWLAGGAESKHKWAFLQLGLLGNDETARRLAPLIRAWPGESQHKRAVNGLDVLGDIGSDVALMMLDGIAQKVKFKGLQENARAKMGEIAGKRGITAEQLSDRLVPDLELEDDGSKTLDFGPRSFRVGFDEHLAPFVIDASGARLRELPKPNSKDDPALSAAAVETWKAMKKDVRALANIQLVRLELGMGNARRWRADELRTFFVEHPLMTHLARRLVWGVYEPALTRTFRVAEDRTYATVGDDALALPDDAIVGIVHRYDLPDADAAAWGKLFGDYELVQPFEQLTRAVYRLADDEKPGTTLERFAGRSVPTRALLKLLSRGWRKGAAVDNGSIFELVKPISGELSAQLAFETGLNAGGMEYVDPTQSLQFVDFAASVPYYGKRQDALVIGGLPPVIVSEVIRDIETLESVPDEEEA